MTAPAPTPAAARRTRKTKPAAPALPPSHLDALQALGFEVIAYQHKAVQVQPRSDGEPRSEWLPEDCVNWTARQLIRFRRATDGNYSFDGWEPTAGGHFGGRYDTVHGALGWFAWVEAQRAGR